MKKFIILMSAVVLLMCLLAACVDAGDNTNVNTDTDTNTNTSTDTDANANTDADTNTSTDTDIDTNTNATDSLNALDSGIITTVVSVQGMNCGGCINAVTRELAVADGIADFTVEIGKVTIEHDPTLTIGDIREIIMAAGFTPLDE